MPQKGEGAYDNHYAFTGREFDAEATLYYFRNRYMNSLQGRFTSRDKIGIWGDTSNYGHGYAYTRNNPTNLVDPSGLRTYLMQSGLHGYIVVDVWDAHCCEVIGAMRIDFSISKQWRSILGAVCSVVAWYGDVTLTWLDSVGDDASPIVESYNTTCEEDKNLLRWAKGQAEAVPMYNLALYNCWHFTIDALKQIGVTPWSSPEPPGGAIGGYGSDPKWRANSLSEMVSGHSDYP